jgi:hypothetical protein
MPYHVDASVPGGRNYNCRSNKRANQCFGLPGSASTAEGRSYNKAIMKPVTILGTLYNGANAVDLNNRLMSSSFFKLRAGLNTAQGTDPAPCSTENDDTSQIGCITNSDGCTIGYAGREAAQTNALKSQALDGVASGTGLFPTDQNIINLVNGSAPSSVYPLARRLYVATMYGFGSTLAGLSFGGMTGGEAELAKCYGDNFITKTAIQTHKFVPLPLGVACMDYDETGAAPAFTDPTASATLGPPNPGTINAGTCGATSNNNACTTAATKPEIGPTDQEIFDILSHYGCQTCHANGGVATGTMNWGTGTLAEFKAAVRGVLSTEVPTEKRVNDALGGSTTSYLFEKLSSATPAVGVRMPANGPPYLTPFQLSEVQAWIDNGSNDP